MSERVSEPVVLTTPLGGDSLARLAEEGATPPWYALAPRDAAEWQRVGLAAAGRGRTMDWLAPLAPALPADGPAAERLQRAARGGFVITTGQQPGLFGGPIYGWSKALSALALADELERLCGVPVAPVFWAATDDSDFLEAASTHIATAGGVHTLTLSSLAPADTPLRDIPLGDVSQQLNTMVAATGAAIAPEVLAEARACYAPDATIGEAYVVLLRHFLGDLGIAVLDGGHPAVTRVARPVLERALSRAQMIDDAIVRRDALLRTEGYEPQVARVPGLSLVFTRREGRRVRMPIAGAQEGLDADAHPQLSANVLLRPVVERALLPTVAYMAGPGELAYFGQVGEVAEALDLDSPVAAPRWSGMIIEPHVRRILDRYDLEAMDLREPHQAETRRARRALSPAIQQDLANLRERIRRSFGELESALGEGEPELPPAVLHGAERDLLRRAERLERRIVAAEKRRDERTAHDLATARAALYPFGRPQERVLNLLPLLARHGLTLLGQMRRRADEHAAWLTGSVTAAPSQPVVREGSVGRTSSRA